MMHEAYSNFVHSKLIEVLIKSLIVSLHLGCHLYDINKNECFFFLLRTKNLLDRFMRGFFLNWSALSGEGLKPLKSMI